MREMADRIATELQKVVDEARARGAVWSDIVTALEKTMRDVSDKQTEGRARPDERYRSHRTR